MNGIDCGVDSHDWVLQHLQYFLNLSYILQKALLCSDILFPSTLVNITMHQFLICADAFKKVIELTWI